MCLGECAPARANDATYRFDAVTAFEEGRHEDALRALERGPLTSDLAYLRMRLLAELGRYGEALEASTRPASEWPKAVVRDLEALRVSWAASAGRCDAVPAPDKRATRASERLAARCAFVAGDYRRVRELLTSAKDPEGRALYVRSLIELGEHASAAALARAFYIEQPAHRDAALMRSYLERDGKKLALTAEERMQRAAAWLEARQPEAAVTELAPLKKLADRKLEPKLWHLRGEALFRTRKRYPEAQKAFTRAAKLGKDGETEEYDAFHAIRSSSRAGDDRGAIKRYKAFATRYPKSKLAPDAVYLAAWLSAREKLPSAASDLKRFVDSNYGARAPGLRRDALWELSMQALQKRKGRDALMWLDSYAEDAGRTLEQARAAYWQGRAALLARDKPLARQHFQRALREDRLGYYAQLAARRLNEMGDGLPPAFEPTPSAMARPALRALPEEVVFYRELGFHAEAAEAVNRALGTNGDRMQRVAALLEAGDAPLLFYAAEPLLDRILEGPPDASRAWLWEAALPQPYRRIVLEQTAKHDLDPALFYGHMQVESRYKPHVVSSADAIGLMQLIPETASVVAEQLGLHVERSDLMRPHVNIRLGAAYLGGLVARYERQYPLAIAAYNVGTQKVDEWLRRGKSFELDLWVESIPVEQTRNYVRRVITGWSRYHALANSTHPWSLPLPRKVRHPTR